ncbi:MAG: lipid II flippase MurJ [Dehalococcoidia bacterium]
MIAPARAEEAGVAKRRILDTALALAALTVFVSLFGFIKEAVTASRIGTSSDADVYYGIVYFTELIYRLGLSGIGTAVLVPLLASRLSSGEKESARSLLGTTVLWTILLAALGLLGLLAVGNGALGVLLGGFSEQERGLAHEIALVLLPAGVVLLIASLFTAYANALGRFLVPRIAQFLPSLVIVLMLVLSGTRDVRLLALAYLLGAAALLAMCILVLREDRPGLRHLRLWHPELPAVFALGLPVLALILGGDCIGMVQRRVASGFDAGAIAALSYGFRTAGTTGMLGTAMATVALPALSISAARGRMDEFRQVMWRSAVASCVVVAPLTFLLMLWAKPVTELLFARGAFDEASVALTSTAVVWFLPAALFDVWYGLALFAAYARRRLAIAYAMLGTRVAVTVPLYLTLAPALGFTFLVAATTAGTAAGTLVGLLLSPRIDRTLARDVGKILIVSLIVPAALKLGEWALRERGLVLPNEALVLVLPAAALLMIAMLAFWRVGPAAEMLSLLPREARRLALKRAQGVAVP